MGMFKMEKPRRFKTSLHLSWWMIRVMTSSNS